MHKCNNLPFRVNVDHPPPPSGEGQVHSYWDWLRYRERTKRSSANLQTILLWSTESGIEGVVFDHSFTLAPENQLPVCHLRYEVCLSEDPQELGIKVAVNKRERSSAAEK